MAEEDGSQVELESRPESRFRAFVSYSHADKAAAQKLHRKLETYRLPKHLRGNSAGSSGGVNAADGRIGAIFRDREDLPAAEDLSESVKLALSASEALVVLCSPDAQKSPWVAREIELFREIHPDRPVLAAILRGEPSEAFPEPLKQGREPLAADLRKEGDGARLGFLKVVAGIAEVPLDALVNRDAQRRVIRVTAITVAAVAAMVVMALMTTFALQARDEAQRQQAEAEGLVEYMLTDLRDDLKGVGRLDVMGDVNERAMEYYDGQGALGDLSDDSLERRARILHVMGEDEITIRDGSIETALTMFRQAHRVTEALLLRDPDNPDRIFGHAQSDYWIGKAAEQKDDWATAKKFYSSYALAGQRLVSIDSDNEAYLMEMGWGFLNMGILEVKSRDGPDYGRTEFRKAIHWMERARASSADDVEVLKEIGNTYAWLADSFLLSREFHASLAARNDELRTKRIWLERQPLNNAAKYAVAKAQFAVGYNLLFLKRNREAKSLMRSSLKKFEDLVEVDPENKKWSDFVVRIKKEL